MLVLFSMLFWAGQSVSLLVSHILNPILFYTVFFFFFSSRRRHTRLQGDWSSDVCSSDLNLGGAWRFVMSDRAGNDERLAFLYDSAKVTLLEEIGEVAFPPKDNANVSRSEERRVGKECRSRWSPYH